MKLQTFLLVTIFMTLAIPTIRSDPSALEKALNPNANPYCTGDCKVLKKIQAIFQLRGAEKNIDTQLNFFNWKFFYVFSDHLSLYTSTQAAPVAGKYEKPQEVDFLNNFPIDDIQTPCNAYKDVCTVSEYNEQVLKPLGKTLTPNQKAMDTMGKNLWHSCFLLSQDLLDTTDEMGYVCSSNLEDFQAAVRILNEMINKFEGKEFVGRLYMVNDKNDDLTELNAHISSTLFVGNNVNDEISVGSTKEGYQEYFSYTFASDISAPAYTLLKENVTLDWKGDDSKKPDIRRCFAVSVLTNNGKTKKDKFFCVFTTNNGSISLDETNSNFEAIEWVTKLNRRYKTTQVKAAQEALKSLTGEISPNSPQLDPAKNEIHDLANKVDKDCQEKVKQGILDQRNCDEMKMKVVVEKAAELCQGNKECLKAIKEAIKTGALPLTSNGTDLAWSPENPYKASASSDAAKTAASSAPTTSDTSTSSPTTTTSPSSSSSSSPSSSSSSSPSSPVAQAATLANLTAQPSTSGGDKGATVMSTFGADKGKDLLNKEIANNEVAGGAPPPASSTSTPNPDATKADERMNGILKDVGISQRDLDKLKNSDAPAVKTETGQPQPTKEEIQKAINTFNRIFYGRPVDKIEGVEKYCIGTSTNLNRAVGILPFTAQYEPFLDYLGYIRTTQSEK